MFEHLFNCHGEWAAIIAFLGSAPLVGAWVRAKFNLEVDDENR